MENLYIHAGLYFRPDSKDNIENAKWLNLLCPFTAVKNLYLSKLFATRITPTLQELTGARTTEVLPTLQNLFLGIIQPFDTVYEGITQFISARQLTNRPVVLSIWKRDSKLETP
jgi:hypothetical protein